MIDVLIVGGGLSGLFSACLSAEAGLETTIVMRGRGGFALSHGALELYKRASPSRSIAKLTPPHPYALAGKKNLAAGLKAFQEITNAAGLRYQGGRSSNQSFLSAAGSKLHAALLPPGYAHGNIDSSSDPITLGSFRGLRDFQAHLTAEALRTEGMKIDIVELPLIHPFSKRELYPIDAARIFDDLDTVVENARAWKPHIVGSARIGLPAVLGLIKHTEILELIEELLGVPVFEIPTLPPSVPGLRLEHALRNHATKTGVRLIEGPRAVGRVQKQGNSVRAAGALLQTSGKQSAIDSRATVLATGSFIHGGLEATQDHRVYEPVFNLPVDAPVNRENWVDPSFFRAQPLSSSGVSVNASMQPLDIHGEAMFENLFAVGGVIGNADRTSEGSRQGIDIATAFCAISEISRRFSL